MKTNPEQIGMKMKIQNSAAMQRVYEGERKKNEKEKG